MVQTSLMGFRRAIHLTAVMGMEAGLSIHTRFRSQLKARLWEIRAVYWWISGKTDELSRVIVVL